MTTIVYSAREGEMAGDRRVIADNVIDSRATKVFRRDDGALCGAAGSTCLAHAFSTWFTLGEIGPKPALSMNGQTAEALIARPDGQVEYHGPSGMCVTEAAFYVLGSGGQIATGAMAMGASAASAVAAASRYDPRTGDGIDVVKLGVIEAPALAAA